MTKLVNIKRYLIAVLFSFVMNCSGQKLINGTTADLATDSSQSISAQSKAFAVNIEHHGTIFDTELYPDYMQDDLTKQFQNNLGYTITLTTAAISYSHMHLISDGNDIECTDGIIEDVDLNYVDNILAEDLQPTTVVNQLISDVAFCQYEIHLSADNETSLGLDEVPEAANHSFFIIGKWEYGTSFGNFSIIIDNDVSITDSFKTLEGEVIVDHPIHYHDGETGKIISFGTNYDRWFDDIDFTESASQRNSQFVQNVQSSIVQELASDHATTSSNSSSTTGDGHGHTH